VTYASIVEKIIEIENVLDDTERCVVNGDPRHALDCATNLKKAVDILHAQITEYARSAT
jgi:hypothetical protein